MNVNRKVIKIYRQRKVYFTASIKYKTAAITIKAIPITLYTPSKDSAILIKIADKTKDYQ